jgi:CHAT domain
MAPDILKQLQDNYNLLQSKLIFLQREKIIKVDAGTRFQLEQEIKEIQSQIQEVAREIEKLQAKPSVVLTGIKRVLFLASNPKGTAPIRLNEELRDIEEGLRRSQMRDHFELEQKLAVRPRDVQRAILDFKPNIIHFSGHGAGEEGLVFENEMGEPKLVSGEALASLFALFKDQIDCVVLNGCYSQVQALVIAQHINYVIGMNKAIGDKAAIEFAVGFYDALGAGKSIEFAYRLGCSAILMHGIQEHLTPVLLPLRAQSS